MIEEPEEGLHDSDTTDVAEESPPEVSERPTRGLFWVFAPTVLGVLVGAVAGVVYLLRPGATWAGADEFQTGLTTWTASGGAVGLGAGMLFWVLFPYQDAAKIERRDG